MTISLRHLNCENIIMNYSHTFKGMIRILTIFGIDKRVSFTRKLYKENN